MGNTYTVDEMISIIEHTALDLMSNPIMVYKKLDGTMMTMAEVANHNSLMAMNNAGIRSLAQELVNKLTDRGDQI